MTARVAVVVPVHDQAAFLPRALGSLLASDVTDLECVVVDDGSHDGPQVPDDPRVHLLRLPRNRGLGAALNAGLDATTAPVVAYLAADDAWDRDHLGALLAVLDSGADLAWSGVRWAGGEVLDGPQDHGLQLVQVAHRRTGQRWPERDQLEADDLDLLMWRHFPDARGTGRVTCTWTDHPAQRHKAIRETSDGGLNVFRRRYRVDTPLRLHSRDSGSSTSVRCTTASPGGRRRPAACGCCWSASWPSTPSGSSRWRRAATGCSACGPTTGSARTRSGRCRSAT